MELSRNCAAVIPCFNEAATVRRVVTGVRRHLTQVIVVDDGSCDGTSTQAAAAGAEVVRLEKNLGKGAALRSGWRRAAEMGCSWVLMLDGDGQHSADDIPRFLERGGGGGDFPKYSRIEPVNRREMAGQGMEFRLQAAGRGKARLSGEFSTCPTMLMPCRLKPGLHTLMRTAPPGSSSRAPSRKEVYGEASLVVGNRMDSAREMPLVRRWVNRWMSRRISNLTRLEIPDSQCGFRLARLQPLLELSLRPNRFEIESAMLVAFAAAGLRIEFVPVQTIYGSRRSHIRPVADTWRWLRWRFDQVNCPR